MATILVVDDNPSNFDVIVDIFAYEAPTLYYASSGSQALELMAQTPVDLVLLDVMMPEMDGVEVCSRIKNDPRWAFIPVAMVTALSDREEMAFCLQSGADDFISKPVNALELRARIRSLLRLKEHYDRLQGELETRRLLAHRISRDLRDPLSSILLSAEMLKLSNLTEKQHHNIDQIYANSRYLSLLMNDLLLLSQENPEQAGAVFAPFNLRKTLEKALAEFQNIAETYRVALALIPPAERDYLLQGDETLIARLLDNLLSYLIRCSPTDSHIQLTLQRRADGGLTLEAQTQGVGWGDVFGKDERAPFSLSAALANPAEPSLGLIFCQWITALHGGRLTVEHKDPKSPIFCLEFESSQTQA
ncbi:MAG: response regulator [Cyanobacteriota bacterium]|jgi:two-component system sensor histidine kinase/response regulator